MHPKALKHLLVVALLWVLSGAAWAEVKTDPVVIVVNRQSSLTQMKKGDVINIFMGRHQQLPNGVNAIPVDYRPAKEDFYLWLINKNLAEVNAFWARLVFSGRANPPLQINAVNDLRQFVANNQGAIGYLQLKDVDRSIKVVEILSDDSNR